MLVSSISRHRGICLTASSSEFAEAIVGEAMIGDFTAAFEMIEGRL